MYRNPLALFALVVCMMMSDPTAQMYRREADRLLGRIRLVRDPESHAALIQMARQYLKLAELHDAPGMNGDQPVRASGPHR